MSSRSLLALTLLIAVGLSSRAPVSAAGPLRAGVLPSQLSQSVESIRGGIESAIADGAALAGANVEEADRARAAATWRNDLVACATQPCITEMGKLLEVDLLVRSEVESTKRAFSVHVSIARVSDGRELGSESATCKSTEPCSPIPDTTRDVAREAMRKALAQAGIDQQLAERQRQAGQPSVPAPAPTPPSTALAPASSAGLPSAPGDRVEAPVGPRSDGADHSWLPWLAFIGSGVSFATGVYLLTVVDGQQISCEPTTGGRVCLDVRDAAVEGWSAIGLGALAAGAGLYLYFGGDRDRGTGAALTLGPRGALLRGTF